MKGIGIAAIIALVALFIGACTMDLDGASSTEGPSATDNANFERGNMPVDRTFTDPGAPEEIAPDDWWEGDSGLTLDIRDARLAGAIGPVGQLDHAATDITGYADPGWSSISVTVDKEGDSTGAAMAILDYYGDIRELGPGTYDFSYVSQDSDEFWFDGSQQSFLVVGCSGDDPGVWEYDQPADEVEVIVEEDPEDPNVLAITFEAHFSEGSVYDWETGGTTAVNGTTVSGVVRLAQE